MIPLLTLKNREIQQIFEAGHSIYGRYLVVYFHPNTLASNRFGFCVGRKLGGAVRRNRLKRLLREAVRQLTPELASGWDLLLVARAPLTTAHLSTITGEAAELLQRAGIFRPVPAASLEDHS